MNSILWKKCPNSVFCGKSKLTARAAQSVIQWNQGAAGSTTSLYACSVRKYGINTLRGIRKENSRRIVQSSIKCKNRYNKRRQILRQERKSKPADKENYFLGDILEVGSWFLLFSITIVSFRYLDIALMYWRIFLGMKLEDMLNFIEKKTDFLIQDFVLHFLKNGISAF